MIRVSIYGNLIFLNSNPLPWRLQLVPRPQATRVDAASLVERPRAARAPTMSPRGSRYIIIRDLGLKDYDYYGFWGLSP